MITLYSWTTPNGKKPAILLAELELPYELKRIDISKREQKQPDYLALNPNGKIPALVDGDTVVFESGAILLYLAEKTGVLVPSEPHRKAQVMSWLFWQMGGPGPMFGQLGHFKNEKPSDAKTLTHFLDEAKRLASVLDGQLAKGDYICEYYSIADIANYTWFAAAEERMPEVLEDTKHIKPWLARVGARPAVKMGMALESPKRV